MPDGDSARAVAGYYSEHRTEILAYAWLGTIGTSLQLVFFTGLARLSGSSPLGRDLSRVGLACIVVEVVGVCAAFSIFAAVAYREPDAETAQVLTDLAWLLINLAAGPVTAIALPAFAVALWRAGIVGRWLLPISAVVAVAHLVVAATFAREGAMSPSGAVAFVVPLLFFSWFVAVAAAVMGRRAAD